MATPSKNLDALLIGTGEFSFSEGATTAAEARSKGWLDFGNIRAFTPNLEVTRQEHFGSYRGIRRKDKSIVTEQTITYQLRCDQWDLTKLAILFGADDGTNHTQSAYSSQAVDALDFSTNNSVSTKWYDITDSEARIRKLTSVTFTGLTEGTDFEVDTLLGRVRFMTQQTSSITPTISAPAITASDADFFNGLKPLNNLTREGFGRLVLYDQNDQNKVVMDHVDFSCEVTAESSGEVDGENFTEITLTVTVTDEVGNLLNRAANS